MTGGCEGGVACSGHRRALYVEAVHLGLEWGRRSKAQSTGHRRSRSPFWPLRFP